MQRRAAFEADLAHAELNTGIDIQFQVHQSFACGQQRLGDAGVGVSAGGQPALHAGRDFTGAGRIDGAVRRELEIDAEGMRLHADFAQEEVGARHDAEDQGHAAGVFRLLDADVAEAAEAPEVADVLADGGGVERLAHLCREVHCESGAGRGDGSDDGGGPSDGQEKEEECEAGGSKVHVHRVQCTSRATAPFGPTAKGREIAL